MGQGQYWRQQGGRPPAAPQQPPKQPPPPTTTPSKQASEGQRSAHLDEGRVGQLGQPPRDLGLAAPAAGRRVGAGGSAGGSAGGAAGGAAGAGGRADSRQPAAHVGPIMRMFLGEISGRSDKGTRCLRRQRSGAEQRGGAVAVTRGAAERSRAAVLWRSTRGAGCAALAPGTGCAALCLQDCGAGLAAAGRRRDAAWHACRRAPLAGRPTCASGCGRRRRPLSWRQPGR